MDVDLCEDIDTDRRSDEYTFDLDVDGDAANPALVFEHDPPANGSLPVLTPLNKLSLCPGLTLQGADYDLALVQPRGCFTIKSTHRRAA